MRRYYGNGEERLPAGGTPVTRLYYTTDHLGSIRELVDATGAVRARYDYDPYGNRTKQPSGDLDADFGFTGHYTHAASGLVLAPYRGYDPGTGRWLSRDPIEEDGGGIFMDTSETTRLTPLIHSGFTSPTVEAGHNSIGTAIVDNTAGFGTRRPDEACWNTWNPPTKSIVSTRRIARVDAAATRSIFRTARVL